MDQERFCENRKSDGEASLICSTSNPAYLNWAIDATACGLGTDDIQGEFAHFYGYPEMKAVLAHQSDVAKKSGWKERGDCVTSYADCFGEDLWNFLIANIPVY